MILSPKHNRPLHPPLNIDQQNINAVTSHTHIGFIFSNDRIWHEHIDYVKAKSWFRLNVMRMLKYLLDRKALETIYTTFII